MKHKVSCGMFVILLLSLSGCGRVVDWGKNIFDQGEDLPSLNAAAYKYIRSCTIYDQLATAGMFDAMWISDEIRTLYTDAYARRRGKNDEFKKTFLRRQLEANQHFVTFYVLSPFELPLGDPQSLWQTFLRVNDQTYQPVELKPIELEPEYVDFFGKKHSRFKESYIIKFDTKNIEGAPIVSATDAIELCFRSLEKQIILVWRPDAFGSILDYQRKTDCIIENCK